MDIIKERKRMAELVRELKAKHIIRTKSKIKQAALKLIKRGQVIYGSTASSQYAPSIKPKDIDISVKNPKVAAEVLRKELLKQGIKRSIKEKYIKQIRRKIYEIGNVSYSPLTKVRRLAAIRGTAALPQEVLALSRTISEPSMYYRSQKDLARLKQIARKLKGIKREEFEKTLSMLQFEKTARTFFYTAEKAEKLRKQRIFFEARKGKYRLK